MSEAEYLACLRETAEKVDVMLSGMVTAAGQRVRVDPRKVRELFRQSIRQFAVWWKLHHRATKIDWPNVDVEIAEPPNPIDWPTPAGRKAFTGDRQMACYVATLCAIHDTHKNPCVGLRSWRKVLRALLYELIRKRDPQAGYDQSVVSEALRNVREHLACVAAAAGQVSEATDEGADPWRVPWDPKDPNFMPAGEARTSLSDGKPAGPTLSKKLGTIPVHYMRAPGGKCRVHIGEYRAWAQTEYPTDKAAITEITAAAMSDIEKRIEAERRRKQQRS